MLNNCDLTSTSSSKKRNASTSMPLGTNQKEKSIRKPIVRVGKKNTKGDEVTLLSNSEKEVEIVGE